MGLSLKDYFESSIDEFTDTYTIVARNTNKAGVYVTYNTPAYVLKNGGLTLFIELLISILAGAVFGISAVFFKKNGKTAVSFTKNKFCFILNAINNSEDLLWQKKMFNM